LTNGFIIRGGFPAQSPSGGRGDSKRGETGKFKEKRGGSSQSCKERRGLLRGKGKPVAKGNPTKKKKKERPELTKG